MMEDNNLEYLELTRMSQTKEKTSRGDWVVRSVSWATNFPLCVEIKVVERLVGAAILKLTSRKRGAGCIASITEDFGGDRYCITTVDLPFVDDESFTFDLRELYEMLQ